MIAKSKFTQASSCGWRQRALRGNFFFFRIGKSPLNFGTRRGPRAYRGRLLVSPNPRIQGRCFSGRKLSAMLASKDQRSQLILRRVGGNKSACYSVVGGVISEKSGALPPKIEPAPPAALLADLLPHNELPPRACLFAHPRDFWARYPRPFSSKTQK